MQVVGKNPNLLVSLYMLITQRFIPYLHLGTPLIQTSASSCTSEPVSGRKSRVIGTEKKKLKRTCCVCNNELIYRGPVKECKRERNLIVAHDVERREEGLSAWG